MRLVKGKLLIMHVMLLSGCADWWYICCLYVSQQLACPGINGFRMACVCLQLFNVKSLHRMQLMPQSSACQRDAATNAGGAHRARKGRQEG